MEKIFFLIAAVLFLLVGFDSFSDDFNMSGEFNATAWGLCALAVGLLVDDMDGRGFRGGRGLLDD